MATDTSDEVQVFLVIDNEVVMEIDSYREATFLTVKAHHIFNTEYPTSLKMCFKFLEEYVFGMATGKKTIAYSTGVRALMSTMMEYEFPT